MATTTRGPRFYQARRDRGQILVLAALSMTVVFGFAALAIDVGHFLHTRTDLQKDVDALALAGAQGLPSQSTATSYADALKGPNGLTSSDSVVYDFGHYCDGRAFPTGAAMITVTATRHNSSFLARVAGWTGDDGKGGATIKACATAGKFSLGGLSGARPFALEDTCMQKVGYGDIVTVKYDSSTTRNCDSFQGNYAAVDVKLKSAPSTWDTGASAFRDNIMFGSPTELCTQPSAATDSTCCPTLTTGCTALYQIQTETGNVIGPTKQGLKYLFDNTPANCDTWDEVTNAEDHLNPECWPWSDSYTALGTRLVVVPVVHGLWSSGGTNTINIQAFAIIFLEDMSCTGGNGCDIKGRFIKTIATLPNARRVNYNGTDIGIIALVQ
jgi:hypothetical protein